MPISAYSDDELLSAIRQDDEKAFEALFERYWKQVHAIAYSRVLSTGATQEIVQNVFTSLWDQRATLSISHLPSYLNALTKKCVLNYLNPQPNHGRRWGYHEQVTAQHPHVNDHNFKVNELMKPYECEMNGKPKKIFRFQQLEEVCIAELARSLTSLKRLFNSISHNHQKG